MINNSLRGAISLKFPDLRGRIHEELSKQQRQCERKNGSLAKNADILSRKLRECRRDIFADQRERILQEMDESKGIDGDPFYKITNPQSSKLRISTSQSLSLSILYYTFYLYVIILIDTKYGREFKYAYVRNMKRKRQEYFRYFQ